MVCFEPAILLVQADKFLVTMDKTATLQDLADLVQGEVSGDSGLIISNLADINGAVEGEISFVVDDSRQDEFNASKASAFIIPRDFSETLKPAIRVANPLLAATIIQRWFVGRDFIVRGIHPTALVGENCQIADEVSVGPLAVIGDRVKLGARVSLAPGVVLADDVVIGDDSALAANVVVGAGCLLGRRLVVHGGAVIGSDGFGFVTDEKGKHLKRPQVGNVVIEDDVEIGANACIDRATFGSTIIGAGTKIDNMVQVAHNVKIGPGSLLAAQSGIAGSTSLGRGVVLGGQAGVADHLVIGDGLMAAGKAGITGNHKGGEIVAGFPAISHRKWLRASVSFPRVPDLLREVRALRQQVLELSAIIHDRNVDDMEDDHD